MSKKKKISYLSAYEHITVYEFAKRMGVAKQSVMQAIKEGRITEVDEDGYVVWERAKDECEAIDFGQKSKKEVELIDGIDNLNESTTYAEALRLEKIYKAQLAKLEVDKENGTLVLKDEVYRELFDFGNEIKNTFLSIPDRITDELISLAHDRVGFHSLLSLEIEKALEKLSKHD